MIYIGIDPAVSKLTAVAVRGEDIHLLLVDTNDPQDCLNQIRSLSLGSTPVRLIVEGQRIYKGSAVRNRNILDLANRSGFFEGLLCGVLNVVEISRPLPQEWKGQVPADMYRKRILKKHPEVAKLTSGMTTQEQEDLAHAYGLSFFLK